MLCTIRVFYMCLGHSIAAGQEVLSMMAKNAVQAISRAAVLRSSLRGKLLKGVDVCMFGGLR